MVKYNFPKYEVELELDDDVYFPAEDTFFLLDLVDIPNDTKKIVEIGSGSGIISIVLAKNNPEIQFLISDISFSATKAIKQNLRLNNIGNLVDILCMDKLEAIHNLKSDIIIWNPPYLPDGEEEDTMSPLNKLMLDSLQKNKISTIFYTIFSSLSWSDEDIQDLKKEGMNLEIKNQLSLFFEKLYLVKIDFCERNEKL